MGIWTHLNPYNYFLGDSYPIFSSKGVVSMLLTLLALYLSYKCNLQEPLALRIFYLLLAYIFQQYYIIYYIIYHRLMRQPCAVAFGQVGMLRPQ
jgi:hypothetical protein